MLRTLSLLLLIVTVGYSQWRDSSRVLVPAPSGKAVKVTQFAIGDTNTWKVSGAIAYMGGNFYIANGTYYVLMAGSGSSSADTATFVTKNTTQVISAPKYFTARQYMTSLNVDTINARTATNTLYLNPNATSSILGGNVTKGSVNYVNFFGSGQRLHITRQTLWGFGGSNWVDTIYFGHATVSLGVPFVAAHFEKPLSGGETLGGFATFSDGVRDTSSYVFQQWAGVPGTGGTQTSSFTFEKNFGTASANFDKWDGNRKVRYIYIDTANGVFLNQQISEVGQNFGDWTLSNKNFIVSAGYVDSDSTLDDGTTWRTSASYHSGLGASSMGNLSTGTINSNGNTITVGSVTSSGTVSTTGTGAHTFASAGSGFTTYRDGGAASFNVNTYGNTNGSFYYSNTFAGTRATPTQIGSSQVLGNFMGSGYINGASRDMAKMQYLTKSTPSATNYSSYGRFQFVPDSSTTLTTHSILDWTNLTTPRLTLGTTAGTGRGNLYIDTLVIGTTIAIDANRKHTNVGGIATTGAHGVAPIVDTVTYTSMSSGMSKNLTSTAGMYRLLYTIFCTTADAAAGSVQLTLSFNNGAAQTMTSAAVNLTSTANKDDDVFVFYVASGTPSISTAITGSAGTSKYSLHATVERLK